MEYNISIIQCPRCNSRELKLIKLNPLSFECKICGASFKLLVKGEKENASNSSI